MNDSRFLFRILTRYFLVIYLVVLVITSSFMASLNGAALSTKLFAAMEVLSYSLLYLMPALILTATFSALLLARARPATWKALSICTMAVLGGTVTVLFLTADRYLFKLYGYHFNGFVWNLIVTPGGTDSLGATLETKLWAMVSICLVFAVNSGMLWLFFTRRGISTGGPQKHHLIAAVILLTVIFAAGEGGYAYARFTNNEPLLRAASIIPLHLDTTAVGFFRKVGIISPPIQEQVRIARGEIKYPAGPVQTKHLEKYPNIVWLTAESFRWDLFSPEVTPNLWKFSKRAVTFNRHYSGGNRTRMGMFSMFYGLYAPYWYGFQEQKVPPVLMKQVVNNSYQMTINTSQSFSYPELKDTVFAGIPTKNMQELQSGPSWQRDRENISDIIKFMQLRDNSRPFFSFMFFESTHAPYDFPESAVIRDDYLKQVNYLQLNNFTGNVEQLHNRYINAAHHVDAEVGRVLDYLEQERLMDDTIVLFTGDHGEEFMENGHWGHGHNEVFPETQIRVPLVLWIPGQSPQQIDHPTSHNQIPATILPLLGVTSPAREYASEEGLFAPARPYRVVGSYDYLGIVDAMGKISFPFTTASYFHYVYSDTRDNVLPLQQQKQFVQEEQRQLEEVTAECNRFTANGRRVALKPSADAISSAKIIDRLVHAN